MPGTFLGAMLAVCTLLAGCGVESVDSSVAGNEAQISTQQFIGRFLQADSSPLIGATITMLHSGDSAQTASDGSSEISISPVSGDIEIKIAAANGNETALVLPAIPAEASVVTYTVLVQGTPLAAQLTSISFSSDGAVPAEPPLEETPVAVETPTASQPPAGAGTPRPTATPTAKPDDAKAKAIARGKRIYSGTCGSCHPSSRANGKSSSALKKALALPQHKSVRLGGSSFSDLMAYLGSR